MDFLLSDSLKYFKSILFAGLYLNLLEKQGRNLGRKLELENVGNPGE
jgi:hypothetical protein